MHACIADCPFLHSFRRKQLARELKRKTSRPRGTLKPSFIASLPRPHYNAAMPDAPILRVNSAPDPGASGSGYSVSPAGILLGTPAFTAGGWPGTFYPAGL